MTAEQGTVAAVSSNGTYAFTKPVRDEIVLVTGVGVAGDVHAGVHVKHRGRVRADATQPNLRQVHLIQQELFAEVGAKGYAVRAGNLGENVTTSGLDLLGLPVGTILRFGPPRRETAVAMGAEGTEDGQGITEDGQGLDGPDETEDGQGLDGPDETEDGQGVGGEDTEDGQGAGQARAGGVLARAVSGAGSAPLAGVLAVAAAAKLDGPTAASAVAVREAAERDPGDDTRPALIVSGLRNPCGQINGFRAGLLKEVLWRDSDGKLVRKAGVMAVVLRGGAIRPGDVVTAELPPLPHVALERV